MNCFSIVFNVESSCSWHERLCHVSHKKIKKLMDLNLIPNAQLDNSKCEVCVQVKQTKKHFKSVRRDMNILKLFIIMLFIILDH